MTEKKISTSERNEILRKLQHLILQSVFSASPLPGSRQPTRFPDLAFLERQSYIIVLDEQLASPFFVEDLPKPVKVLSYNDILQKTGSGVNLAFIRFHPPKWKNECIELNLEVQLASNTQNSAILGLGGIQVQFHEVSGQWVVAEEASYYAT